MVTAWDSAGTQSKIRASFIVLDRGKLPGEGGKREA